MIDQVNVSLTNLANGAVIERFDDELKAVLSNILDPNTTLAQREITIKVTFKPDQNRSLGAVGIKCASKLAPANPLETTVFIGNTRDGAVATEHSPQAVLPMGDVTPLRAVAGGAH